MPLPLRAAIKERTRGAGWLTSQKRGSFKKESPLLKTKMFLKLAFPLLTVLPTFHLNQRVASPSTTQCLYIPLDPRPQNLLCDISEMTSWPTFRNHFGFYLLEVNSGWI